MIKKQNKFDSKDICFYAVIFYILISGLYGCKQFENGDAPVDNSKKFWIINGFTDSGTDDLKFRVFHGITANETYHNISVVRDNNKKVPLNYQTSNFEITSDVYYLSGNKEIPFASRSFLFPKDSVWKVFWYPADEELPDGFFDDLKNRDKVVGKIIVYEMNETDSK